MDKLSLSTLADRLRLWLARGSLKVLAIELVPPWAREAFMTPTFRALCDEGVKANGAVFACLSALAFAFPEPKLRVYQEGDGGLQPLPQHPLQKLLTRPNPQMGMAELLQYTIIYTGIGGNCYWYKVRSQARRVVELWPLNDSQVRPVGGGQTLLSHYVWDDEQGHEQVIPAADIVQFKWIPDPMAPWRGLAPLKAVAREVDTDNEATRYLFALLKNDAIPRVAVVLPSGMGNLSEPERLRFHAQWSEKYGGDRRGSPALLEGGVDVKKIGLDLQEMAFEALRRVPEARIAAAFRVPPIVAGLNVGLERSTYANYGEAVQQFSERTLVPLWRSVADEIATDLLPEFGGGGGGGDGQTVAFDLSTVVALQENQAQRRTFANEAWNGGGITRNEYRAMLGLPPDARGDVYKVSLTVTEVPAQIVQLRQKALVSPASGLQVKSREETREARRKLALSVIAAQREQRRQVAGRMEAALGGWFGGLADHVVSRALQADAAKGGRRGQRKDIGLEAEYLLEEYPDDLDQLVKRFYLELIQLSWDTWNLSLGVDVAFDLSDPAVTRALELAGARVKAINETTLKALREALQYGSERGWSIQQLVRGDPTATPPRPGLRDLIEQTYRGRAENIARTELGHAQQVAAAARYAAAGVKKALILDNGFDDSAPGCVVLGNGGQGTIVSLEWARAHPLGHPRCLVGKTKVLAANVSTAYLRPFDGEVVVLRTAGNHNLTCTPNHPVLTDHGWIAAGLLKKGNQIVCCRPGQWRALVGLDPQDDDVVPTIKELADALRESGRVTACAVPGATEDFHGDGIEGKVSVVLVNRSVKSDVDAAVGQQCGKVTLRVRDVVGLGLKAQRLRHQPLVTIPLVASGDMRRGGDILTPGVRPPFITDPERFGLRANDSQLAEPAPDSGSIMTEHAPDSFTVEPLVDVQVNQPSAVGAFLAQSESALVKSGAELLRREPEACGDIPGGFAGLIALEELVEVERRQFDGHVYNLSTATEWFIADGIITHNCVRAIAPWLDDDPADEERLSQWAQAGGDSPP